MPYTCGETIRFILNDLNSTSSTPTKGRGRKEGSDFTPSDQKILPIYTDILNGLRREYARTSPRINRNDTGRYITSPGFVAAFQPFAAPYRHSSFNETAVITEARLKDPEFTTQLHTLLALPLNDHWARDVFFDVLDLMQAEDPSGELALSFIASSRLMKAWHTVFHRADATIAVEGVVIWPAIIKQPHRASPGTLTDASRDTSLTLLGRVTFEVFNQVSIRYADHWTSRYDTGAPNGVFTKPQALWANVIRYLANTAVPLYRSNLLDPTDEYELLLTLGHVFFGLLPQDVPWSFPTTARDLMALAEYILAKPTNLMTPEGDHP